MKSVRLSIIFSILIFILSPVLALAQTSGPMTTAQGWSHLQIDAISGTTTFEFSAIPRGDAVDAVMGVSAVAASEYQDLIANVRFNREGYIDARDFVRYRADRNIGYSPNQIYNFSLRLNLVERVYDVYVSSNGEPEQLLISNARFRIGTFRAQNISYFSFFERDDLLEVGQGSDSLANSSSQEVSGWTNFSNGGLSGNSEVVFKAVPLGSALDAVMGISRTEASQYQDLIAIARFNRAGTIDARDAGEYRARSTINYSSGLTYTFRMVVNFSSKSYSLYVTPEGGNEILVLANARFRTEQAQTTNSQYFAVHEKNDQLRVYDFNYSNSSASEKTTESLNVADTTEAATDSSQGESLSFTTAQTETGSWSSSPLRRLDAVHQVSFTARPTSNNTHALVGLSDVAAEAYRDVAVIVRFHESGRIDARDGGAYRADRQINYRANMDYHIRLVLDVSSKRYRVFVKEGTGQELTLLSNAAFRSDQSSVSSLDSFVRATLNSAGLNISNLEFRDLPSSDTIEAPKAPEEPVPSPAAEAVAISGKHTMFPNARLQWGIDFQSSNLGLYQDSEVRAEWEGNRWSRTYGKVNIESDNGNRYMRVHYPKGAVGHAEGGAIWAIPIPGNHEEFYVSFKIRFKPGFIFPLGGKIPGLAGGDSPTGGEVPNNGFSARMGWASGGRITQYVYHPDQPGKYGENFYWGVNYPTGRWVEYVTRIKLNTPGSKNGILETWIDGRPALKEYDMRFRNSSSIKVDEFLFSTFFGGNSEGFAAQRDEWADFDDFRFFPKP